MEKLFPTLTEEESITKLCIKLFNEKWNACLLYECKQTDKQSYQQTLEAFSVLSCTRGTFY